MNRVKRLSLDLYKWFWQHTEFWLDPGEQRPYTFILRDCYHNYPLPTVLLLGTIFYCLGRWWLPVALSEFLIGVISLLLGTILGHLWWGMPYIPNERTLKKMPVKRQTATRLGSNQAWRISETDGE